MKFLDLCKDGVLELIQQHLQLSDEHLEEILKAKNKDGKTALHFLATFGHEEAMAAIIDLFIKHHLPIDATDKYGFTPLLYACYRGYDQDESEAWESRLPIVTALVEIGKVDVNHVK